MRIGSMLGDVLKSFFKKPITQPYPFERKVAPANFRGKLVWDREKCTGCQLCVKDCPADAIELITIDRANKRFVLRYNVDRCTFCAQCAINCRFNCLDMSQDQWELASLRKEPFTVYYGQDEDIDSFLRQIGKIE